MSGKLEGIGARLQNDFTEEISELISGVQLGGETT
jgi:hypothetical protein